MHEQTPGQYGHDNYNIHDEPVVETDKKYEMSESDIDSVAAMVFEQVAQNPDGVAYHIYNTDAEANGAKFRQGLTAGHNHLYGNDNEVNQMVDALSDGVERARGLKKDDRYIKTELLVIEERPDGSAIVGYGLSGTDDMGRPKVDQVSFRLDGAAAAMMYAVAEDPAAINKVVQFVGYASGLPENIYEQNLNPSRANFGDEILNIVQTGPNNSQFKRVKKRSQSSIK